MRLLVLAATCLALAAQAQTTVPAFDLERLTLNPGARDGLLVGGGDLLPDKKVRVTLAGHYQHDPLVYVRPDGQRLATVVGGRATAHLAAAFSVTRWLELGLQAPLIAWQGGAQHLDTVDLAAPSSFAFGTPWAQVRIGFMRQGDELPFDLALSGAFGIPIGSGAALARDAGFTAVPRLGLGRAFGDVLRVGLDVGATLRARTELSPSNPAPQDTLGTHLDLGLGVSTLGEHLRGELSVRSAISFGGAPASTELMAGARYAFGHFEVFALGGPGFGRAPGTPAFRAMLGLAFTAGGSAPEPVTPLLPPPPPLVEKCVEGKPYALAECPELDVDGDGVKNGADACANVKGSRAASGCPDADEDGVVDEKDKCPGVAGLAQFKGCPDTDGDGITDAVDQCPKEPGPEDRLGCPGTDTDRDGVIDEEDRCPKEPGEKRLAGCPERDSDGDGIIDSQDNCTGEKGPRSNQGCPPAKKQLVVLTREALATKSAITFDKGKPTIQKKSLPLLDAVALVLKDHAELAAVTIGVHLDRDGKADAARALTLKRAEAVKAYLVKKGVAATRLKARGYGFDRPIADNDTPSGRELNRRVEFVLMSEASDEP